MKDKITKNLLLNVTFERNKSAGGIELPGHKFYLIGSLPVLLLYQSGQKQIANLKAREEIQSDDPYLREMTGVKASDKIQKLKYKEQIERMVFQLEKAVESALKVNRWFGQPIKDLILVKL